MDITKAIIPAAGLGTRFMPFTKSVPKEMIPLLNKPAIHYIIEEGIQSSITNFTIVTSKEKQALANYFDPNIELEMLLKERNKSSLTTELDRLIRAAQFSYIRQPEPMGLGHAVWMARHTIGKEYFGIFLPDDIIVSKQPGLEQLIRIARQEKASVIAVQEVPMDCISSYGVVAIKKQITPNLFQVSHLVEKPSQKDAPSNLAIIGRYVLSHKIFESLNDISTYAMGELQLTDGISHMMKNNEKVFAYKIQGTRYDIGTPIGWIKAVISMSLQHPEYAPAINKFLNERSTMDSFLYNQHKNISHTL
ncbi:MAG: UTP--glucose-1-phosphate uridylyltransferase [Candidatus Dependentiae bacterium]|nr:UTP--glucose-1-phosphate uridylyltransferase [Candidatus Dependentiae bacterium]